MSRTTVEHEGGSAIFRIRSTGRLFILPILLLLCTLFYYFGELADWAAWEALRQNFFYGIHDVHRLLFLVPIIYAGYAARVKGAVIVTLVTFTIFLPRAFFISPYPDPLLRTVLFIIIAGTMGCLTGISRNEAERRCRLEALIKSEREKLLGVLRKMKARVLIIGPDYRIRFVNPSMMREFGKGVGSPCYKYLHKLDGPCDQICRLQDVRNGAIEEWECPLPNGSTYDVLASPFLDSDGAVCQLVMFRDMAQHKQD